MRQPIRRTSWLRAPLVVVAMFLLALLALYPAATVRAQAAPVATAARPDTVDGEVSDVVLKGKQLEVVYRNTGTVATALLGELQVRTEDDSLVATVPIVESVRIEAGKRQVFRVPMPTLPPGKYTLYAVMDFGGAELTAAQAALEIRK
ncbi:MAG: hypothetical protein K2R93_13550 [Gemmatimonadaceae bacterium]|nr:hypothetical protein [Gemmatimonadaceae bacterium]